jgi:hypothetical protein
MRKTILGRMSIVLAQRSLLVILKLEFCSSIAICPVMKDENSHPRICRFTPCRNAFDKFNQSPTPKWLRTPIFSRQYDERIK